MNQATKSEVGVVLSQDVARQMMPLIRSIAARLARRLPKHISTDDLVSAGCQGLCAAMRRYDPERADGFEAYAERRIRGAMLDELRSIDLLSRDRRAQAKRVSAATRALHARLGRAPVAEEIAAELGVTLEVFWAWQSAGAVSVSSTSAGEAEGELVAELSDTHAEPADERVLRIEREEALGRAMTALPSRLQRVLELHYVVGMTLQQIGSELGVSESRVCQLESDAVRRIREYVPTERSYSMAA
jgi:RNA polymerase sigma factor for flagellar operon FliA